MVAMFSRKLPVCMYIVRFPNSLITRGSGNLTSMYTAQTEWDALCQPKSWRKILQTWYLVLKGGHFESPSVKHWDSNMKLGSLDSQDFHFHNV